jgi:hypothetical protein
MYSGVHREFQRCSYIFRPNYVRARLVTDNLLERTQAFHAMMYEVTPFDQSYNPPEVSCYSAHLCKSHRSTIENSPYSSSHQSTITILFASNVSTLSGGCCVATFQPSIHSVATLFASTRLNSERQLQRLPSSDFDSFCSHTFSRHKSQ